MGRPLTPGERQMVSAALGPSILLDGIGEQQQGTVASRWLEGNIEWLVRGKGGNVAGLRAPIKFTMITIVAAIAGWFFYYKLGDKTWGNYGFYDAFNLNTNWFATSYLAIDQGPIIDMIENYRSGLLWNLFMSSPEVKTGMKNLGFKSPNL